MAGKNCVGRVTNSGSTVKETKAYAEGAIYRASDTALNAPVTDNPHAAASDAGIAWIAGWDLAETLKDTTDTVPHGCLAPLGVVQI